MPKVLPASVAEQLQASLAKGKVPKRGTPAAEAFDTAFMDFYSVLEHTWSKKAQPLHWRRAAALITFWLAIPGDGLLIGIACNQPEVVPAALAAAKSLKLARITKYITQVAACIPPAIHKLKDPEDRLIWYESSKGVALAAKLSKLEDRFDPLIDELTQRIVDIALEHPGDFFKPARRS